MPNKNDRIDCRTNKLYFRLIDEFGRGERFGGLKFKLICQDGNIIEDTLGYDGFSQDYIEYIDFPCGYAVIQFDEKYEQGQDPWYDFLVNRKFNSQEITKIQFIAENTPSRSSRINPFRIDTPGHPSKLFYSQVEISEFVESTLHLPRPPSEKNKKKLQQFRNALPANKRNLISNYGFVIETDTPDHVIEIRSLRAYRPLLSTSDQFSALNLYQCAMLANLSYRDFGEEIKGTSAYYNKNVRSLGNILKNQWACHKHIDYDGYYFMMEDVPYSKRFEIIPYNAFSTAGSPSSTHFIHTSDIYFKKWNGSDTEGFITHSDNILLICMRGTGSDKAGLSKAKAMFEDAFTDANTAQVKVEDIKFNDQNKIISELQDTINFGHAHKGFYTSYKVALPIINDYLQKYYNNQKIIVIGHSLGGAIATLVGAWLTRNNYINVTLYTYGSPRAGSKTFVEKYAKNLTHYRVINKNDPIPRVPPPNLIINTQNKFDLSIKEILNKAFPWQKHLDLTRRTIEPVIENDRENRAFTHHGHLYHFTELPNTFSNNIMLWEPSTNGQEMVKQSNGRPYIQGTDFNDHFVIDSYIVSAKTTFNRLKKSANNNEMAITTNELVKLQTNSRNPIDSDDKQLIYSRALTLINNIITKDYVYGSDILAHPTLDNIIKKWK